MTDPNYLLREEINRAYEALKDAPKLIWTGMGTSGNVARLLAGTFNSIGVPSVFLHPCDALHGDSGVCKNDETDLLIIVSASGETPELIRLWRFLHPDTAGAEIPIETMILIGNPDSTLGRMARVAIPSGPQEGFLPFKSTEAAIRIGHDLAWKLGRARGLGEEGFRRFHPANQPSKTELPVQPPGGVEYLTCSRCGDSYAFITPGRPGICRICARKSGPVLVTPEDCLESQVRRRMDRYLTAQERVFELHAENAKLRAEKFTHKPLQSTWTCYKCGNTFIFESEGNPGKCRVCARETPILPTQLGAHICRGCRAPFMPRLGGHPEFCATCSRPH